MEHRRWRLLTQKILAVLLSSAESEAKVIMRGCIEALYVKHPLEHQTAAAPKPSCSGLDQGAEQNTWRCR